MNMMQSLQDLNANNFNGFSTAAFPASSLFRNNTASLVGCLSDSTLFSSETMASPMSPQTGFGDLASFSSAWGLNPNSAAASQSGLSGGSAMPAAMETMYQQMLTSALMNMMSLMSGMCSLNGQNNAGNLNALNNTDGTNGNNANVNGNNANVNGGKDKNGVNDANSPDTVVPKGGTLNGKQLVEVLKQAGFTGDGLKMAWAIAMRESGGKPSAFNGNAGTGDKSYGLFQINMLGSLGPARLKELGLKSNEDLLDPLTNAKAAFKMSKGGTDFGAWAVGPNAYRRSASLDAAIEKYLKEYPG